MIDSVPTPARLDAEQVFCDFQRLTSLNVALHDELNDRMVAERDELVKAMTAALLSQEVRITELPAARQSQERPIETLSVYNTRQLSWFRPPDSRLIEHPATGILYDPHDYFRFRRRSNGRVEGVDAKRAGLVVRHRGLRSLFDRDWIRLVDSEGQLLVNLEIR